MPTDRKNRNHKNNRYDKFDFDDEKNQQKSRTSGTGIPIPDVTGSQYTTQTLAQTQNIRDTYTVEENPLKKFGRAMLSLDDVFDKLYDAETKMVDDSDLFQGIEHGYQAGEATLGVMSALAKEGYAETAWHDHINSDLFKSVDDGHGGKTININDVINSTVGGTVNLSGSFNEAEVSNFLQRSNVRASGTDAAGAFEVRFKNRLAKESYTGGADQLFNDILMGKDLLFQNSEGEEIISSDDMRSARIIVEKDGKREELSLREHARRVREDHMYNVGDGYAGGAAEFMQDFQNSAILITRPKLDKDGTPMVDKDGAVIRQDIYYGATIDTDIDQKNLFRAIDRKNAELAVNVAGRRYDLKSDNVVHTRKGYNGEKDYTETLTHAAHNYADQMAASPLPFGGEQTDFHFLGKNNPQIYRARIRAEMDQYVDYLTYGLSVSHADRIKKAILNDPLMLPHMTKAGYIDAYRHTIRDMVKKAGVPMSPETERVIDGMAEAAWLDRNFAAADKSQERTQNAHQFFVDKVFQDSELHQGMKQISSTVKTGKKAVKVSANLAWNSTFFAIRGGIYAGGGLATALTMNPEAWQKAKGAAKAAHKAQNVPRNTTRELRRRRDQRRANRQEKSLMRRNSRRERMNLMLGRPKDYKSPIKIAAARTKGKATTIISKISNLFSFTATAAKAVVIVSGGLILFVILISMIAATVSMLEGVNVDDELAIQYFRSTYEQLDARAEQQKQQIVSEIQASTGLSDDVISIHYTSGTGEELYTPVRVTMPNGTEEIKALTVFYPGDRVPLQYINAKETIIISDILASDDGEEDKYPESELQEIALELYTRTHLVNYIIHTETVTDDDGSTHEVPVSAEIYFTLHPAAYVPYTQTERDQEPKDQYKFEHVKEIHWLLQEADNGVATSTKFYKSADFTDMDTIEHITELLQEKWEEEYLLPEVDFYDLAGNYVESVILDVTGLILHGDNGLATIIDNGTGSIGGGDGFSSKPFKTLAEQGIDIDAVIEASGATGLQAEVLRYCLEAVGCAYSQANRFGNGVYDCSSLAYRSYKASGTDISNAGATTAAAEAQKLVNEGKTVTKNDLQPGDLIFWGGHSNGRYLGIYHVAIYAGNGKMVEAQGTSAGVVYTDVRNEKGIVAMARP